MYTHTCTYVWTTTTGRKFSTKKLVTVAGTLGRYPQNTRGFTLRVHVTQRRSTWVRAYDTAPSFRDVVARFRSDIIIINIIMTTKRGVVGGVWVRATDVLYSAGPCTSSTGRRVSFGYTLPVYLLRRFTRFMSETLRSPADTRTVERRACMRQGARSLTTLLRTHKILRYKIPVHHRRHRRNFGLTWFRVRKAVCPYIQCRPKRTTFLSSNNDKVTIVGRLLTEREQWSNRTVHRNYCNTSSSSSNSYSFNNSSSSSSYTLRCRLINGPYLITNTARRKPISYPYYHQVYIHTHHTLVRVRNEFRRAC